MSNTIQKIKSLVRDAQAPTIVRIKQGFATIERGHASWYDAGYYRFPAGKANELIKSKLARLVTDERELELAHTQILARDIEASEL